MGKVPDLARVVQERYQLAVAVVMGQGMDTVVVDNEATAKECIRYLREQRLGTLNFVPLATIRTKPVNERLRNLGGTAKLAIDLLEYDPAYERAFLHVCGCVLLPRLRDSWGCPLGLWAFFLWGVWLSAQDVYFCLLCPWGQRG